MLKSMSLIGGTQMGTDFGALGGFLDAFDIDAFQKALVSGSHATDAATYTQGRALQSESLEPALLSAVQELAKDFPLLNSLATGNAKSVVDQWNRRDAVGGYPGGGTISEMETLTSKAARIKRLTAEVKFLATMRGTSLVQESTESQINGMAEEQEAGMLELMTTAEYLCYYGDSSCVETEFDGALALLIRDATAEHILDLRGGSISADVGEIHDSQAFINDQGNFGQLTDAWCSSLMKSDLDKNTSPKHRIMLDNSPYSVMEGTPLRGVNTNDGDIMFHKDKWIKEGQPPFAARGGDYAANVGTAGVTAPVSVTGTASAAVSGSQFYAAQAGLYYYGAEGGNSKGRSTYVVSAQVAVAAGDQVSVAIVEANGGTETCYFIHRSSKNGSGAAADVREMVRVPKDGGGTTTYIDKNQNIPGTSHVFLFNQRPGSGAIKLQRLLPLTKFNFPAGSGNQLWYPFALVFFLYLRMALPKQHRILKNALPSGSIWRP